MSNAFLNELPFYYQDIREFKELAKVVSQDYEKIDQALVQLENDQFVLTSSEAGILRREKDFGILADPKTETLEFRKARVLVHMQTKPNYVLEYLKKLLGTLVGEDGHDVHLDVDAFEMEVGIYSDDAKYYTEAERMLEKIVPLNIDLMTSVIMTREYLILKHGSYKFPFLYKITNKFGTASMPGMGRVTSLMALKNDPYGFDADYRFANRFRTEGVHGMGRLTEQTTLLNGSYGFDADYRFTNKFCTASLQGIGSLTSMLALLSGSYGFNQNLRMTNKFHTSSIPGGTVQEESFKMHASSYTFKQGLRMTGKFVAKGA